MPELQQFPVLTPDRVRGTIFRRARFLDRDERSIVRLEDGREFEVSSSEVQVRPDGTFLLNGMPPRPNGGMEEHVEPRTRHDETGARPAEPEYRRAGPDGSFDLNDYPLYTEEAGVERVPVNRLIDTEPQTRQEGDVTVIPIVEEVLVVEKRLLLKEEIRIRRTRNQVRQPKRVVVDGSDIRVLDGRDPEVRS
jgi:hypothetical protein